jgi:hypothetical protein
MALGRLVKDTGYVLLGLGVMRFQKAAVRRREIEAEMGERLAPLRAVLPAPLRDLIPKGPAQG